ncbi:MAG: RNA degradosome polyphosphate kinase, partial [Lachnospiraceae bacterium]|nr:RNA degradosome polyphosphate kinase [Lachnospiraceae bacterium]
MAETVDFSMAENYTNRELSWLLFDKRVLSEAQDAEIPLFERLKFLSISASNLDEFFMVRVASLKDMVNAGYHKKDIAGLTPESQLAMLNQETHRLVEEQYDTYHALCTELMANGLRLIGHHEELTRSEAAYVDQYFEDNVYPVLTPMAVDS